MVYWQGSSQAQRCCLSGIFTSSTCSWTPQPITD